MKEESLLSRHKLSTQAACNFEIDKCAKHIPTRSSAKGQKFPCSRLECVPSIWIEDFRAGAPYRMQTMKNVVASVKHSPLWHVNRGFAVRTTAYWECGVCERDTIHLGKDRIQAKS